MSFQLSTHLLPNWHISSCLVENNVIIKYDKLSNFSLLKLSVDGPCPKKVSILNLSVWCYHLIINACQLLVSDNFWGYLIITYLNRNTLPLQAFQGFVSVCVRERINIVTEETTWRWRSEIVSEFMTPSTTISALPLSLSPSRTHICHSRCATGNLVLVVGCFVPQSSSHAPDC